MQRASILAFSTIDRNQSTIRITPWRDADEFDEVGERLLSAGTTIDSYPFVSVVDDDSRQHAQINLIRQALRQVIVWRTRSASNQLPYTIESTACLAELLVHDYDSFSPTTSTTTSSPLPLMGLRLAYSSAIIRAVNGIADALQQRRGLDRANALSVATLCKRLGLPGWVVDMRHDAAHGELPTLPCLRMAAKTLLEFFSTFYWKPHHETRRVAKENALNTLIRYNQSSRATENESSAAANQSKAGLDDCNQHITDVVQPIMLANEFVTLLSVDAGIPLAVEVLIHGAKASTGEIECFLIPGSVEPFPETDAGFLKVCQRYKPLLVTIQHSWPGFFHALIVCIIDSIVTILKEDSHFCPTSRDSKMYEVAVQRKLFFLMSWVRFLTSQKFISEVSSLHSPSRRPASLTQSEDTKTLKSLPADNADATAWDLLAEFNIPVRSICEHLSHEEFNINSKEINQLLSLFETLRSENKEENLPPTRKRKCLSRGDTSKSSNEVCLQGKKPVAAASLLQPMSLEAMEAMLQSSDEEEDAVAIHAETIKEHEKVEKNEKVEQIPWSQCLLWDTCAIGTLPGKPLPKVFTERTK